MGFLYRFLDKENNILYVGKTTKALMERLRQHNHLPTKCYQSINQIDYKEINSNADLGILETYYINKYLPIYNVDSKGEQTTSLILTDPYMDWKEFDFKAYGLNIQEHTYFDNPRKEKNKLTPEEIKEHQRLGIERAKAEGKYKGRKRKEIDKEAFEKDCIRWRQGECTAVSLMKKYNIGSPTFYRRVHEWNL